MQKLPGFIDHSKDRKIAVIYPNKDRKNAEIYRS